MRILVLGKGGREHAISWKLSSSNLADAIFVMPGNPGMSRDDRIECVNQDPLNFDTLYTFCKEMAINLVVVGPEAYLEKGVVDFLTEHKIPCIGPRKEAAKLESSKVFAKKVMFDCDIPTADYRFFNNHSQAQEFVESWPYSKGLVIKADGLASGKGVFVCKEKEEALKALNFIMKENGLGLKNPKEVIIEERLEGKELSAFALTDGIDFAYLGDACDYKRLKDGDKGPNTGGMGCYAPADWINNEDRQFIKRRIFDNLFSRLKQINVDFRGVLFAGLIKTEDGIKVLEFNTRFGDPETQVILPLLDCDLAKVFHAAAHKKVSMIKSQIKQTKMSACHVVKASGGYPGIDGEKMNQGNPITIDQRFKMIESKENKIFYAGVSSDGDTLINTGGRVLGVTALAPNRKDAKDRVYRLVDMVSFEGAYFRKDIGEK